MGILDFIKSKLFLSLLTFILCLISIITSGFFPRYIDLVGLLLLLSFVTLLTEIKRKYYIILSKKDKEVRSNGESFIKDYFRRIKIKFIYEKKLKVGSRVLKPDFYLPEYDVYVEYRGMSDFESRKGYDHKKSLYKKEGVRLIELYPDNLVSINQLDWKFNERLREIFKND